MNESRTLHTRVLKSPWSLKMLGNTLTMHKVTLDIQSHDASWHQEQGDTSVEDKLKEGWVGPRAITLEAGVSIWVLAYGSRVKFINMKDENSPNLVWIEYSTNVARDCMTGRVNL